MSKEQIADVAFLYDENNSDAADVSFTLRLNESASGDWYGFADGGATQLFIDNVANAPTGGFDNDWVYWTFTYDSNGDGSQDTETALILGQGSQTISILGGAAQLTYNPQTGAYSITLVDLSAYSSTPVNTSIMVQAWVDVNEGSGTPSWRLFNDTANISLTLTCFTPGTMIACPDGARPVEDLSSGDLVLTAEGDAKPIRWIGRTSLDAIDLAAAPSLLPICISKGALGEGMPDRDLVVSPQHRVLVSSKIAQRIFDSKDVLIPAKKLVGYPGIDVVDTCEAVDYLHVLLDEHSVLISNGAPSESLFWGEQVDRELWQASYDEAVRLFPELLDPGFEMRPARPFAANRNKVANLIRRSLKNDVPLMQ